MTEEHVPAPDHPNIVPNTEEPVPAVWSARTVAAACVAAVVLSAGGGAALGALSNGDSSGGPGGPGGRGGFGRPAVPGRFHQPGNGSVPTPGTPNPPFGVPGHTEDRHAGQDI